MKIRTEITHTVEYRDLDQAVNEFYGLTDYDFAAEEEMSNDSAQTYHLDGQLTEFDVEEIKTRMIPGGNYQFMTSTILNDMARAGAIPVGNYVVTVSW